MGASHLTVALSFCVSHSLALFLATVLLSECLLCAHLCFVLTNCKDAEKHREKPHRHLCAHRPVLVNLYILLCFLHFFLFTSEKLDIIGTMEAPGFFFLPFGL